MADIGDLVPTTDDKWMTLAPQHCPNRHPLDGGKVLVGHAPCSCGIRGGHTSWRCQVCDTPVYGPPLSAGCRPLAGPAAVRT